MKTRGGLGRVKETGSAEAMIGRQFPSQQHIIYELVIFFQGWQTLPLDKQTICKRF